MNRREIAARIGMARPGMTASALPGPVHSSPELPLSQFCSRGARRDWSTVDTSDLVHGVASIGACLGRGIMVHCLGRHIGTTPAEVSKFPLIQQVPAFVFRLSGMSEKSAVSALTWLNAAVVLALVAWTVRWAYRRGRLQLAVIAGVLMTPGMLLPYANESFGEPLATAAFGAVVRAALRTDRASGWLLPAALVAADSKETAAPFVLLLGLAAIGLSGAGRQVCTSAAIRLLIGLGCGVALQAAFNIFRYGTLLNHTYLGEARASISMIPSNALGMLISPDAGVRRRGADRRGHSTTGDAWRAHSPLPSQRDPGTGA